MPFILFMLSIMINYEGELSSQGLGFGPKKKNGHAIYHLSCLVGSEARGEEKSL